MAVGHAALPSPLLNGRSASTPDLGGDIALRDAYAMWIAPLAHGPPLRA
jgi:hypothetical protein